MPRTQTITAPKTKAPQRGSKPKGAEGNGRSNGKTEGANGHQISVHQVLHPGELLNALRAFKKGDFSVRLPLDRTGVAGEIAQVFNDVIELSELMFYELGCINRVVGKEGKL